MRRAGEVADLRGAHLGDAVAVQVDAVAFRQQQVARAFLAQRLDPDRLGQAHVALQRLQVVGAQAGEEAAGVQLRAVFAGAVEHMGEAQLVFQADAAHPAVFQLGGAEGVGQRPGLLRAAFGGDREARVGGLEVALEILVGSAGHQLPLGQARRAGG